MISYIIWNIEPEVFHGFSYLRWYGLSWVLGVLVGYQILARVYKSERIPNIELETLATYVMLGAIIGARLGHILFYDPIYYLNNPIEILPIKVNPTFQFVGFSGLASHGGILGAFFGFYLYNRSFKGNYLWMLDRLMIAGAALGGFIRLGNLINSEIIGIPSTLPWAFVFTKVDQVPRHPAQLYEAIFYIAVSILTYFIWRSKRFYGNNGFIFGLGLALIFMARFFIEFLKENQVSFEEKLTLNMGQTLSIPLVLVGIFVMIWSLRGSHKSHEITVNHP